MTGWTAIPEFDRLLLQNATLPVDLVEGVALAPAADGLARADIVIEGGIASVAPAGGAPAPQDAATVDLDGGMILPGLVDMHTHLDKGHIWPRRPNPDGTFDKALDSVRVDRETLWRPEDVRRRMEFGLRSAYAHGTTLIRTHIDSSPPQHRVSWPVFRELRAAWRSRIELQGVALIPIDMALDADALADVADMVADHQGVLGAATFMMPRLEEALDALFRAAAARGLELDLHVDETSDPGAHALRLVAEASLRHEGFRGGVVCGHCCSLALQPEAEALATLDLVAKARVSVVSLPLCNLYLQDRRAGRTPRWRGVTLLHEMRERGIPVAVASDNTRDPFYAYGDLDMLEVLREAARILHLDHPWDFWPAVVARGPADIVGREDKGRIMAGLAADLVLFRARRWTELLSRPQSDRVVLRDGRAVDAAPPDYRELDDLMGGDAWAT